MEELLFNADFRTRLKPLQDKWISAKITIEEYLKKRKQLEKEYELAELPHTN